MSHLDNILPKILARGLQALRESAVMPRIVNSDYSAEAVKKGTTIDVPVPSVVGTIPVTPSNVKVAPTDITPSVVQIALSQWRQNEPIGMTDKEMTEVEANSTYLPMAFGEAIRALANEANDYILAKYKGTSRGVYGFISNPSDGSDTIINPFATGVTDTSGVSAATNARKVLNQQLAPRNNRRGVLNYDCEAAALELASFSDAEKIMSSVVKIEGDLGRKYGIDWFADDAVPDHTVGTCYEASPSDVTCKEAESVGDTAISILDAGAGTLVLGDIFTIAGDSQTYVVTGSSAPYTLHGSNDTQVSILPALKVAVSGSEVITVKNSHAVNLVFHRDAFAFAMRSLKDSNADGLGSKIMSMQDSVTGLVLRLEVSRQHKQTVWEFDILYGADLVRPELAMRIAGAV